MFEYAQGDNEFNVISIASASNGVKITLDDDSSDLEQYIILNKDQAISFSLQMEAIANKADKELEVMDINAVTALYAFAGWLTSMEKPITFSDNHWATPAADMVNEIIKLNNITGECDFDNIKIPSDFIFPVAIDDGAENIKPAFTQEMADNGEFPSVGMEVVFKHGGYDVNGIVTAITKEFIVLTEESGKERITKLSESPVKPLTPTIELIDGGRYEFELCFGDYRLGYWKEERNSFFDSLLCANKICGKSEASNIQPLTVEVK